LISQYSTVKVKNSLGTGYLQKEKMMQVKQNICNAETLNLYIDKIQYTF